MAAGLPELTPLDHSIEALERTIKDLQKHLALLKAQRPAKEQETRKVTLSKPWELRGERRKGNGK